MGKMKKMLEIRKSINDSQNLISDNTISESSYWRSKEYVNWKPYLAAATQKYSGLEIKHF